MPQLMVDWALIEKEFLRGVERQSLIAKFGCSPGALNQRVHNGKWVAKKKKLIQMATSRAEDSARHSIIQNGGAAFVERVQKQVNVGLDVLEQNAPETINDAEKHSRVLDNYDKIGRRVYGLDGENGGGKMTFQFNMVADEPRVIEAKVVESCPAIEDSPTDSESAVLRSARPNATQSATDSEPASDAEPLA